MVGPMLLRREVQGARGGPALGQLGVVTLNTSAGLEQES